MSEMKAGVIDPKAVENTTRRIGLQSKLSEKVVNARENPIALGKARAARFTATGEPSLAPTAK
jgi:hypothetical protein